MRIKIARQMAGLTQQELAEATGVSQGIISAYERGTRTPTLKNVKRLADLFGVSIDELIAEDSDGTDSRND